MARRTSRLLGVVFLSLAGFLPAVRSEPIYTAQFLGLHNQAADLNDDGRLAGEYRGVVQYAQFFDGSRWIQSAEGNEFEWSALYGINNFHTAVGTRAITSSNGLTVQAIMVRGNEPTRAVDLGSITGGNGSAKALAINDFGVAVGDALTPNGQRHAVRFDTNGVVTGLGTIDWESSSAIDINNRGDIVGEWKNVKGETRGFLLPNDGIARDIGTLGGNETFVKRLNASGEIIGSSMTPSGELHAFVYSGGEMKDLGTLGGTMSTAEGINDQGVIVGAAARQNGDLTAFIKYPGKPMEDLALLTKVPEPDFLFLAIAINNRGMILARGSRNASNYLLKPGVLEIESVVEGVRLRFSAPTNTRVRIDTGLNLSDWTPVLTNTLSTDPLLLEQAVQGSASFYRAVIQ